MTDASATETAAPARDVTARLTAAFVVGFVGLSTEIAYTRVISFKLFYYYTYFVIGLALLGLGAASAIISLSPRLRRADTVSLVARLAPLAGVVGLVSFAVVARLQLDTQRIWASAGGTAATQFVKLLVMSIALTMVFFVIGLVLAKLIVAEAHEVRRLYFWDLTGAALGCLTAVPLQAWIGPPAMIVASNLALVALGVWLAVRSGRHLAFAAGFGVVALAAMVLAFSIPIRTDATKTLRVDQEVLAGDWGAVFRVDATQTTEGLITLNHDGLWGSTIWRYDGTRETTARFDNDSRQIPFAALEEPPEEMLIIGAAGGNEIMAARTYGAKNIDAVELNPVTAELLRNEFADFTGNITELPGVNYVQGDGRTFLARSDKDYDLIWFVAPDSYAASNAATSGAFVLSESYLYTEEMLESAYDHLSDRGMIVSQFGDFQFESAPNRTARYLATARSALSEDMGGQPGDFAGHTGLTVEGVEASIAKISTIMLFKNPPPAESMDRVTEAVNKVVDGRVIHLPGGDGTQEGITAQLISADDEAVAGLVADYPYDISSIDDNGPFFWHFTPFTDLDSMFSRNYDDSEIAIGERLLLMLVLIAVITAALFLWLPFGLARRKSAVRLRGRGRLFLYFASIGLGFIFVEVAMIQRFSLLLGFPTLSLSVSLFTLLLATAVGARYSNRFGSDVRTRLIGTTATLWAVTLLYLVISRPITDVALAWPEWARIVLVFAMLFPIGVLLGMFLPAGIDRASETAEAQDPDDDGRLVAWCWAVNGFFSVLGSSTGTILSMSFGFNRTVIIGLLLYVVAAALLSQRRPDPATVGVGPAPTDEPVGATVG
ncbi:MAG: hypothetical protein R2704_01095 [Microthrixaceae bacterium]